MQSKNLEFNIDAEARFLKSGLLWNCFLLRWCSLMSRSKHAFMLYSQFCQWHCFNISRCDLDSVHKLFHLQIRLHHVRGRHSDVKTYTLMALHNTEGIDGVSSESLIWLHLTFSLTQQLWSWRLEKNWFPATLTWTLTCNKQQQCYVKSTIFTPVLCGTAMSYIYRLVIESLLYDENK